MQHRKIDAETQQYMERLRIKAPSMHTMARQLSGGNQQKAVVAKWLGAHTKVLIFDEPTRGIDINGRREIYRVMQELLDQGVGILMLTSDYTEALEMSHRIIVMRRGSICKEFQRGEPNESDILREAIGEVSGAEAAGSDPPSDFGVWHEKIVETGTRSSPAEWLKPVGSVGGKGNGLNRPTLWRVHHEGNRT